MQRYNITAMRNVTDRSSQPEILYNKNNVYKLKIGMEMK